MAKEYTHLRVGLKTSGSASQKVERPPLTLALLSSHQKSIQYIFKNGADLSELSDGEGSVRERSVIREPTDSRTTSAALAGSGEGRDGDVSGTVYRSNVSNECIKVR
jgi:hypothetical protein